VGGFGEDDRIITSNSEKHRRKLGVEGDCEKRILKTVAGNLRRKGKNHQSHSPQEAEVAIKGAANAHDHSPRCCRDQKPRGGKEERTHV